MPGPALLRRSAITLAAFVWLSMLGGCGRAYLREYEAGVAANRQSLQAIQLGMTKEEVAGAMGSGDVVNYKKIRLTDPWRSEAFRTEGGKPVEILYYVTDGYQWKHWSEQRILTPIVLEEDRVVGWGWPFLERNRVRYFPDQRAPGTAGAGKS